MYFLVHSRVFWSLKPALRAFSGLKEWGLEFEDVIPALEQVGKIEELQGALANPSDQLPSNPRHFESVEGGRDRVSDTCCT